MKNRLNFAVRLHYWLAGITAIISLPFLYGCLYGYRVMSDPQYFIKLLNWLSRISDGFLRIDGGEELMQHLGVMIISLSFSFFILGEIYALGLIYTARWLEKSERYYSCLMVAALNIFYIPFGLPVGIYTLVYMSSDAVIFNFNSAKEKNDAC